MVNKLVGLVGTAVYGALACTQANAYTFDTGLGDLSGSWQSTITGGAGIRTKDPSCSLTGDAKAFGCGSSANSAQWSNGDDGDLNYKKGHAFTTYLSLTSELLLTAPSEGYKFFIRGTAMYDFLANSTARTSLTTSAQEQAVRSAQLLDLWGEKDFTVGGQRAHVRVGNQVVNWGESYFASGGINATNSVDIQKLLIPGTQLKQALLPAPMISFASGLPKGFSTEGYLQLQWNGNRYPPVGSYWSATDLFGRGSQPATYSTNNLNVGGIDGASISGPNAKNTGFLNGTNQNLVAGDYVGSPYNSFGVPFSTVLPANNPQFGLRLNYKPPSANINFGFYYENYTDKSPVLSYLAGSTSAQWQYLRHRQLFGISTNFPLGDWAIGGELSYRPHDAVALSQCYNAGGPPDANTNLASGDCQAWMDKKKVQLDVNAQLNLTQTSYPFLKLLKADEAIFTAELTWIKYPGVSASGQYFKTVNGQSVYQLTDAAYATWLNNNAGLGYATAAGQGTSNSVGATIDFNWTYDGSLIPGWQVTPGITFYDALSGYTPTFSANYQNGAKSVNVYLLFNQNPSTWQAGINFSAYFGGNSLSQPYGDRNFVGVFVSRNL